MNQRRRYRCLKTAIICIICVSISCITFVNYKYIEIISSSSIHQSINTQKDSSTNYNRECFKARTSSLPKSLHGKLSHPFINLGFPKIGSSSLHSFFGCAGYRSAHYRCSPTTRCSECIQASVFVGLKPFHHCVLAEVYAQIDDGRVNFPQIDYLEELVGAYPNGTFLLTFRNIENWYRSLKKWTRNETRMDYDLMMANITGFPSGMGRNVDEFSTWFCNHVTRVRDVLARSQSALVEIDLDNEAGTRQYMSNLFNVDANCWGRANVNLDLHPELDSEKIVSAEGQSKWFLVGDKMIRGKDGTKRKRNYPGEPFLSYK